MDPDRVVEEHGETTSILRVTSAATDPEWGTYDPSSSTTEKVAALAIVSRPGLEDRELPRGREPAESLRATFKSTTDIVADRDGQADAVKVRGRWYEVTQVMDDQHPLTGTSKLTVTLEHNPDVQHVI